MVWNCCSRYEKSSFGYETNANGMKHLHDGMKQMTNVLQHTFEGCQSSAQSSCTALMNEYIMQCSKPLHAFHALEDHTACHDVGVCPVWDRWATRLICLVWPNQSSVPHCTTNGFFQDGVGVVWVCFVPARTVFVWCGFVLYHCVLFSSLFIYHLNHTVPFSQPKRVENCIVCHWLLTTNGFVLYYWNFFCTNHILCPTLYY